MRSLKFRLWDFEEKEMIPADSLAFEEYMPLSHQLNQPGMMEFTGFYSSSNEEIYEGDIVLRHRNDTPVVGTVVFDEGCWKIRHDDESVLLFSLSIFCDIIGHVFEEKEE